MTESFHADPLAAAQDEAGTAIRAAGIIAIIRGPFTPEQALAVAETLVAEDVRVIEVALNHPGALDAIELLQCRLGDQALIGAGTVTSPAQVDLALGAGARFAVAPNLDASAWHQANRHGLLYLPGVLTPTEIATAHGLGVRMMKLFPVTLGPEYLSALRGPFAEIEFVPTGGVDVENIRLYASAGAVAVGVGSALVTGPDQPQYELASRARAFRREWSAAR